MSDKQNKPSADAFEQSLDQTVSQAYQATDKVEPSATLDESILEFAKQSITNKPTFLRFRGIAASLMLLGVMAFLWELSVDRVSLGEPSSSQEPSLADTARNDSNRVSFDAVPDDVEAISVQGNRRLSSVQPDKQLTSEMESSLSESLALREQEQLISKAEDVADHVSKAYQRLIIALDARTEEQEKGIIEDRVALAQQALFEALLREKQSQQNWRLLEQYQKVLSDEQVAQLKDRKLNNKP